MKLLAVDTALGACSVAVLDGERTLAHRWVAMPRGHAEALAPMVQAAMAEAGLALSALDRLAVTTGPGTFTGQRVGLAFMRGLRIALKRPLVGVTTLEAMAAAAVSETGIETVGVVHEAKRGEVYAALTRGAEMLIPLKVAPFEAFMDKLAAANPTPLALAGTAAEAAFAWLHNIRRGGAVLASVRQPDAVWVARLAAGRPVPAAAPGPLYLRAPDAKLAKSAIRVRPALSDDAGLLASLNAATMPDAWDTAFFAQFLGETGAIVLIAEAIGTPVGFVLSRHAAQEAEIIAIGVLAAYRRNGIARLLLGEAAARAAQAGARKMFLEVAEDKPAASALYGSQGFRAVGRRKNYYGEGRDALLMQSPLPLEIPPLGIMAKLD
jgi:tRNA threonylcarbamoyladenosine biosynthesis protein TsaB